MKSYLTTSCHAATSIVALAVAIAGPAYAQMAPADSDGGNNGALDEIIVSAQKIDTSLRKTPIAITALSDGQLQRADIRSVLDLDKRVPGLTANDSGAFPLNITIRGVGFDGLQNNSGQPGVAFVENGVYIASPISLSADFLDPGQLEILRGPQGTVNGQNADGGAINITTAQPKIGEFHANGEVSYGSYDYVRMRAVVNLPVTDTLVARLAFQHQGHGGWLKAPNQPINKTVGDQDAWSGRASLLWTPTDRLSVSLWGEFFDNDTNGLPVKNQDDPTPGDRTTGNDYPTPQKVRSRIAAGTVAYDLDFATLKSTTSYQKVYTNAVNSGDMLNRPDALALYGYKDEEPVYMRQNHSVTEEVNLSNKSHLLDWIVGGFFLKTKGTERYFETQQSSADRIPYDINFDPTPAQIVDLYARGLAFVSNSSSERVSKAVYGQATLHPSETLRITGGARYSWDRYSAQTSIFYDPAVPLESKFTKLTGKLSVEYDLLPTSTVYASFSTGVKPGGTNLNPGSTVMPRSFQHEFIRAYEVGSKNDFFNRKLRLNLSAFYNDYRNLQTPSEDPIPYHGGVTNIPKSHVYGLEGEVSLILPDDFRIDGNATVMRSRVDSSFLAIDPYTAQLINRETGGPFIGDNLALRAVSAVDLQGNELGRVPHLSLSGALSKSAAVGNLGKLDLFLQANYRSAFWYRVYNNPASDRVPSQFLMNFNAHFQSEEKPWYLEFQVTNLTASKDITSRYAENFGVGGIFVVRAPPRQFIGRIGFQF